MDLIEEVINWKVDIVFGPVADWFMPGIIELCQKHGKIKEIEKCKQFENVDTSLVSFLYKKYLSSYFCNIFWWRSKEDMTLLYK